MKNRIKKTVLSKEAQQAKKVKKQEADNLRDAQLIAAYRKGDISAFEKLYLIYFKVLLLINLKFFPDKDTAKDATQMQLIEIFHLLKTRKYKEENHFRSWLKAFAKFTNYNNKRHTPPIVEVPEGLLEATIKDTPADEEELSSKIIEELNKAKKSLPAKDRKILVWREDMEYSFAKIGIKLKIKETAVKQKYYRILHRLRLLLEKKGITGKIFLK